MGGSQIGGGSLFKYNGWKKVWQRIKGINGTADSDLSFEYMNPATKKYCSINTILETVSGKILIGGNGLGVGSKDLNDPYQQIGKPGSAELFSSSSSSQTAKKWDYIANPIDGFLTLSNLGTVNTLVQSKEDDVIYLGGSKNGKDNVRTFYKSYDGGITWTWIQGIPNSNAKDFSFDNPNFDNNSAYPTINSIFITKNNTIYVGGSGLGNLPDSDHKQLNNHSLYKSIDKWGTWKEVDGGNGINFNLKGESVLAINEDKTNNIYIGMENTNTKKHISLCKLDSKTLKWSVIFSTGKVNIIFINDKLIAFGNNSLGSDGKSNKASLLIIPYFQSLNPATILQMELKTPLTIITTVAWSNITPDGKIYMINLIPHLIKLKTSLNNTAIIVGSVVSVGGILIITPVIYFFLKKRKKIKKQLV